jgi:hypothetical protein
MHLSNMVIKGDLQCCFVITIGTFEMPPFVVFSHLRFIYTPEFALITFECSVLVNRSHVPIQSFLFIVFKITESTFKSVFHFVFLFVVIHGNHQYSLKITLITFQVVTLFMIPQLQFLNCPEATFSALKSFLFMSSVDVSV